MIIIDWCIIWYVCTPNLAIGRDAYYPNFDFIHCIGPENKVFFLKLEGLLKPHVKTWMEIMWILIGWSTANVLLWHLAINQTFVHTTARSSFVYCLKQIPGNIKIYITFQWRIQKFWKRDGGGGGGAKDNVRHGGHVVGADVTEKFWKLNSLDWLKMHLRTILNNIIYDNTILIVINSNKQP